jgi:hypothetical protein
VLLLPSITLLFLVFLLQSRYVLTLNIEGLEFFFLVSAVLKPLGHSSKKALASFPSKRMLTFEEAKSTIVEGLFLSCLILELEV